MNAHQRRVERRKHERDRDLVAALRSVLDAFRASSDDLRCMVVRFQGMGALRITSPEIPQELTKENE